MVTNQHAVQETGVWSLGWEDPLEKSIVTHSNILARRILWTEETGKLQSRGLQRIGYDWATKHTAHKNGYQEVKWERYKLGDWDRHIHISQSVTSITQSCLILCDPMNCSTPGLPVHHQCPEFTQTSCPLSWWCHPTISSFVIPFYSHLQSFPASGSFQMNQLFVSGGQNIGISPSTSLLPMNIQD